MKTVLLDTLAWDLVVDSAGNIAVASNPYSLAQDAASAIKLYRGEAYYNTAIGVAYDLILGKSPPLSLLRGQFVAAALTVPEVVEAKCFISSFAGRRVRGQVQTTDTAGNISAASF